ncbi:hypothetical protein [Aeromonas caviae]|uniref:hypothetical protein n=1 Tax=Aeromonas caviae TaxID=648 RepID=UPI00338DBD17
MSHQLTFADSEFSSKRRQTRKEIFLSRMEQHQLARQLFKTINRWLGRCFPNQPSSHNCPSPK